MESSNNPFVQQYNSIADILREKNEYVTVHGKSLLRNDALYKYILETTVYPRKHECLREICLATEQHPLALMAGSPDEVQLLQLLLKVLNAKDAIEIGVFSGYSLLATALALPEDGKIIAIDAVRKFYEIGLPSIEKAGMTHKINFRESTALPVLDQLLSEHTTTLSGAGQWQPRQMNRSQSLIVCMKSTPKKFNAAMVDDKRIEVSQLSIADGVTLCHRVA